MDGNIATNTNLQPKQTRVFGWDDAAILGLSAAASYLGNRYTQHQQQKAIDKQNAYNSPVEQMKRFKAAGLNTALLYGQVADGNQSQPVGVPDYGQGFSSAFDKALTKSAQQLEKLKIENDTQRVAMEKKMNDVNVALAGTQIETNKENLQLIAKQAIKLDEETKQIKQQVEQQGKRFDKDMANLDKDLLLKDWQISCSWMDFEQKKFTFEKLMPLQEKYLKGQATYEQVVGNMANELVNAEIFSKRKADLQQWLVAEFGNDFAQLIKKSLPKIKDKINKFFSDTDEAEKGISKKINDGVFGITSGWKRFTSDMSEFWRNGFKFSHSMGQAGYN